MEGETEAGCQVTSISLQEGRRSGKRGPETYQGGDTSTGWEVVVSKGETTRRHCAHTCAGASGTNEEGTGKNCSRCVGVVR